MKQKKIQIYHLNDKQQYEDDKNFWHSQSFEYKLSTLETLRKMWLKIKKENI